jgi:alpha-galactosidase
MVVCNTLYISFTGNHTSLCFSYTQNMRPHVELHSYERIEVYAFHISKEREMTHMYEICCQTLSSLCVSLSRFLFKHVVM